MSADAEELAALEAAIALARFLEPATTNEASDQLLDPRKVSVL